MPPTDPGHLDRIQLADGALGSDVHLGESLTTLVAVMARLRRDCPWDAGQTHRSLVKHLIEETAETVDAIEVGSDVDLVEELGDVLLQVFFHAEIGRLESRFDIDDVAMAVTNKLIARHPYVFGDDEVPTDMMATWEGAKQAVKHRDSVLDGIADSMPTLARAAKVATRLRDTHTDGLLDNARLADAQMSGLVPPDVADDLPGGGDVSEQLADDNVSLSSSLTSDAVGQQLLATVRQAVQAGIDPDQALRDALRAWERQLRETGL